MSNATQIAKHLMAGWKSRSAYATLSGELAPADLDQAYEAQLALQDMANPVRGPLVGRKIALAAKTMQEMCGIDQPIAGGIFANEVHHSPAQISMDTFVHLGLEFELALELAHDVPPQNSPHDPQSVRDLIAAVRPAFELIEDRAADYTKLDVLTIVSDNAWCGGIVIGAPIENWQALDLDDLQSTVIQSDQPDELANTGAAAPLTSLAWVLNHFSGRGITLQAGEQIITGSAARTRFPARGDHFAYRVGGSVVELQVI